MTKGKRPSVSLTPQQKLVNCALKGDLPSCNLLFQNENIDLNLAVEVPAGPLGVTYTPLMAAVIAKQAGILDAILSRQGGIDSVSVKNNQNEEAIHLVPYHDMDRNTESVLRFLVTRFGADLFAESPGGMAPYYRLKDVDPKLARELFLESLYYFASREDLQRCQDMVNWVAPQTVVPLEFILLTPEMKMLDASGDPQSLVANIARLMILHGDRFFVEDKPFFTAQQMLELINPFFTRELRDFSLCIAAREGRTQECNRLLHNGANPNARLSCDWSNGEWEHLATALTLACEHNQTETVDLLIKNGASVANAEGDGIDWSVAQKILQEHDLNIDNNLKLQNGAKSGDLNVCGEALGNGASIETKIDPRGALYFPGSGLTPLMFAIDYPDVVQELLERGANPNNTNANGWSPLHLAIMRRYETEKDPGISDVVRFNRLQEYDFIIHALVTGGANLNLAIAQYDRFSGRSPLHFSCGDFPNREISLFLVKCGGNIYQTDRCGKRPIDSAGGDKRFADRLTDCYESTRLYLMECQQNELSESKQKQMEQAQVINDLEQGLGSLRLQMSELLEVQRRQGEELHRLKGALSQSQQTLLDYAGTFEPLIITANSLDSAFLAAQERLQAIKSRQAGNDSVIVNLKGEIAKIADIFRFVGAIKRVDELSNDYQKLKSQKAVLEDFLAFLGVKIDEGKALFSKINGSVEHELTDENRIGFLVKRQIDQFATEKDNIEKMIDSKKGLLQQTESDMDALEKQLAATENSMKELHDDLVGCLNNLIKKLDGDPQLCFMYSFKEAMSKLLNPEESLLKLSARVWDFYGEGLLALKIVMEKTLDDSRYLGGVKEFAQYCAVRYERNIENARRIACIANSSSQSHAFVAICQPIAVCGADETKMLEVDGEVASYERVDSSSDVRVLDFIRQYGKGLSVPMGNLQIRYSCNGAKCKSFAAGTLDEVCALGYSVEASFKEQYISEKTKQFDSKEVNVDGEADVFNGYLEVLALDLEALQNMKKLAIARKSTISELMKIIAKRPVSEEALAGALGAAIASLVSKTDSSDKTMKAVLEVYRDRLERYSRVPEESGLGNAVSHLTGLNVRTFFADARVPERDDEVVDALQKASGASIR